MDQAISVRRPHKLANLDHESVINRIAAGEYSAHIAKELGVTKQGLQYQISKHPNYQQAREIGCAMRIDAAMAELASMSIPSPPAAPDSGCDEETHKQWLKEMRKWKANLAVSSLDLARVESLFRAVTWQAEREFPHRWGRNMEVTVNTGDLGDRLRRAKERVIEAEPVGAAQQNSPK